MSRAKNAPGRPPVLTRLMVWLRRLPASRWVFTQIQALRGGDSGGKPVEPGVTSAPSQDGANLPETPPDAPTPAAGICNSCEQKTPGDSASAEPVTPEEFNEPRAEDDLPHGSADLPEPIPGVAVSPTEDGDVCERETPGESASGEPVALEEIREEPPHAADDLPHGSADLPEPILEVSTSAAEVDDACERQAPSDSATCEPVASEEILDQPPHAADGLPHGSTDLPEPIPEVAVSATEDGDVCERETPGESASCEPVALEEIRDESPHAADNLPHSSADLPEPILGVSTSAAEVDDACEQEARSDSTSGEPVASEEILDQPPHAADGLPRGSADLPEPIPEVAVSATEDGDACERETPGESASCEPVALEEIREEPPHSADNLPHGSADLPEPILEVSVSTAENGDVCERQTPSDSASDEPVASEEFLDQSPCFASDLPHRGADFREPPPEVAVSATEDGDACEQETLGDSASGEPVAPEAVLDEIPHVADDVPHDSADLLGPTLEVSAPVAEIGDACEQETPSESASGEPVAAPEEILEEPPQVASDLPRGGADLPEPILEVSASATEDGDACEQETPSASDEFIGLVEVLDESPCVTDNLPRGNADLPELTLAESASATEIGEACEWETPSDNASGEPVGSEEFLDEPPHAADDLPHSSADLPPEPPPAVSAPVAKFSEPCDRETLIRRRWTETGIKMWNPRVHGTGDTTLSIQGRVELLAPAPGEKLPRYDRLDFKVCDGQIVCEGVTVDAPARAK